MNTSPPVILADFIDHFCSFMLLVQVTQYLMDKTLTMDEDTLYDLSLKIEPRLPAWVSAVCGLWKPAKSGPASQRRNAHQLRWHWDKWLENDVGIMERDADSSERYTNVNDESLWETGVPKDFKKCKVLDWLSLRGTRWKHVSCIAWRFRGNYMSLFVSFLSPVWHTWITFLQTTWKCSKVWEQWT